jgi:hypothetical protein
MEKSDPFGRGSQAPVIMGIRVGVGAVPVAEVAVLVTVDDAVATVHEHALRVAAAVDGIAVGKTREPEAHRTTA